MCVVEKRYKETIEYYKVYSALIYAVKEQKKLNYADVARIMGIHETGNYMGAETGHLLGEISENEHNNGRPLLSAVVVKINTGIPGDGFFTLACQLHKLEENTTPEQKKVFWKNELNQVYEKWSD
jgi:hypothetical protein